MISWFLAQPLWFVLLVWLISVFGAVLVASLICDCIKQVVAAKQLRILQESLGRKPAEWKFEEKTTRKNDIDA